MDNERDEAQAWFWTASWQQGEREAGLELAAGAGERFESGEDFLAALSAELHGQPPPA